MIKFDNVSFEYREQQKALKNINLTISPGECVLLCGESGCGKTTITKLVNGLIPHFIKGHSLQGSVKIENEDIATFQMYELAKFVGSVFQNPKSQFFNLDSDSELAFGLENEGMSPDEMKKRLEETINELGIQHLMRRSIFAMSGGEKQALAFASVYAMRPRIFVLDEPSANLDEDAVEVLRRQLFTAKEKGHTVLLAEHRLYYLKDCIDRVIYMKEGMIRKEWSGSEFWARNDKERIAFGLRSAHPQELSPRKVQYEPNEGDLVVDRLSFSYGKNKVLQDLCFSAKEGDIIGIVGKNGVGKTTFCRCLCGLLKKHTGQISFRGETLPPAKRRKLIALVMQDVNRQLFSDSVQEECLLSGKIDSEEINLLLESFHLSSLREAHPMTLSGGQKQRLAILTAILSGKKILIFDEPTSGLDHRHMKEVSLLLKNLAKKGHIILTVSHDIEFLNETCTAYFQI